MKASTSVLLLIAAIFALTGLGSQTAEAACLTFNDNGSNAWWQNNCSFVVGVSWTSDVCNNWSCTDYVRPNGRQSINQGQDGVNWRECRGTACTPRCKDAREC